MKHSACGITVLRIVVGAIFLAHGSQKLFVLGFAGVKGFMGMLGLPLPAVVAALLIALEFLGGLGLILGLFTRWLGVLFALEMAGAILTVHLKNGFFISQTAYGYEYALLLLAAGITLFLAGPGALAVDNLIGKKG